MSADRNEWAEVMIHVRRGEEFLVAHRSPESGGYWHPIAGRIEDDEEPAAAALRELREETELEARSLETIGEFTYVREDWESEAGLRVRVRAFLVDVEPGWEPMLNEEHDEYRWLPREEAATLLFWPEPAQLLRALP
jgi:8-oxo-dGTP pyrophosphatase MutT (NUDIX family)